MITYRFWLIYVDFLPFVTVDCHVHPILGLNEFSVIVPADLS